MAYFWSNPDAITKKQIEILVDSPHKLYYPPIPAFSQYIKEQMVKYIASNWASRPGKKTPFQIMSELLHDCTQEYLTKLMSGAGSAPGLNQDIASKTQQMEAASKEEKRDYANAIHIKLEEISKLFTEGYTGVFRENLLFDDEGRPIAVREGDDRTYRFPKCHERLAEDHAAREPKPGGVDFESAAGITAGGVRRAFLTRRKKQKKPKNQKKTKKQKPVRCTRKRRSSRA